MTRNELMDLLAAEFVRQVTAAAMHEHAYRWTPNSPCMELDGLFDLGELADAILTEAY